MNDIKESGTPLYKIACTDCGSSDAKQVFATDSGEENAYCFACNTFDPLDSKPSNVVKINKKEESSMKLSDINSLPTREIADRKLSKETVARFDVRLGLSEQDGKTVTHHYYPDHKDGKLVGYEVKEVANKQFTSVGDRKGELDLWGQHLAPAGRKLFICEGRLDCLSLYQAIKEHMPSKYATRDPAVVSLTRGASGAVKDLMAKANRQFLSKFEEVILCFDNDDAGKKATRECLKAFPLFKVVKLSEKDASDMLMKGKGKELFQAAVWDSVYERQGELVTIDEELIEKACVKPEIGISYPWPTLTKATYGIRPHQLIIVAAAPKIGKSHFEYQLASHLISMKERVGIFDLENSPVMTARRLASKQGKVDFTRPDVDYDPDFLRSTLRGMSEYVTFYDRGASRDWADIRTAIEEQHLLDGTNIFFIDPITALISRFTSSEANDRLNEISTDMSDLCHTYPITIFCFSHVNPKQKGSKSHEAGARVLSSELTGSRAMEKWFTLGIGLSRDRTPECPVERQNISEVYALFDREFGNSFICDVEYNVQTTEYLEQKSW